MTAPCSPDRRGRRNRQRNRGRSRGRATAVVPVVAVLLALLGGPVRAQPLLIDLSHHLVAVTTAYAGTDVLLFGAIEEDGDLVMVVRGPAQTIRLKEKRRIGFLWLNRSDVAFVDVPGVYQVAATRPLADIAPPEVRAAHRIGLDTVPLVPSSESALTGAQADRARNAFLDLMHRDGLYRADAFGDGDAPAVTFPDERLFRVNISFPARAPIGAYGIDVYLFKDGRLVSARETPLMLRRLGLSAELYDFAMSRPFRYGVCSMLAALGAGWAAGLIAARRR